LGLASKYIILNRGSKQRLTVPRTSKNLDGISCPNVMVEPVKTPVANMILHQPMLKGDFDLPKEAKAQHSHASANPHIRRAVKKPNTYTIWPEEGIIVFVSGKTVNATWPIFMIPNPPSPSGPRGRKTEEMTAGGGSLCIVNRW
jgi:hypothetical protein